MDPLEVKRLKLELKRVDTAKEEMEFRIEERLAEISRLKDNIKIQEAKMAELTAKLKEIA
jgi:chromosome segregation ATPase